MELPPLSYVRVVIQRYADTLATLELTPAEQPLVLPTSEWFPDVFTGDAESFERLVARMQGYAGLEDVEIVTRLSGEVAGASCESGGCGSGGCGSPKPAPVAPSLAFADGRYTMEFPAQALGHSLAMTAYVARMLGSIRLAEAGQREHDVASAELAAVALGFGVLLLEASHLYTKSCGGPSIGQATAVGCGDLALAFALFLATENQRARAARNELSPTQRALVDEAIALTESNRGVVERLKRAPERVARGDFKLGEARSWLSRLFSGSKSTPRDREGQALDALERGDDLESIAALYAEPAATAKQSKAEQDDELRALVDEALGELRSEPRRESA